MTLVLMRLPIIVLIAGGCLLSYGGAHLTKQQKEAPTIVAQSNVFESTGFIDDLKEEFFRESDGATVRYGCSDRYSANLALLFVCSEPVDGRRVEKTTVFNGAGSKVGERVVWGNQNNVRIEWNEGARLFSIQALNVDDALSFERSKVWAGSYCWDMRAFDERHHRTNRWTRAAEACLSTCPCK